MGPRIAQAARDDLPLEVFVAQFAPDGDLAIAHLEDTVKWPMDPRKWMRFACQVAGRDLTPAEWSDVLPDREYRRVCP